jgi:hypothetical protein
MKKLLFYGCLLAFLIISSCKKYETQFEGPYNPNTETKTVRPIAFVINGNVRLIDVPLTAIKTLVFSAPIRFASINAGSDKLAVKSTSSDITIADTSGKVVATVPNTLTITNFDWHANNETLYYLDNFTLKFYGKSINIAISDFTNIFPTNALSKKVYAVNILADGSVLFIYEYISNAKTQRFLRLNKISGGILEKALGNTTHATRWLKKSDSNDIIYFGGLDFTLPINRCYKTTLTATGFEQSISNASFVTISPNGVYTVTASSAGLTVEGAANNYNFTLGANPTDLDW